MAGTLSINCIQPGGGAYVVDGGRPYQAHLGVPSGGAADCRAQTAANRLLERPATATCLELTQRGGRWLLAGRGQFVITGADMNFRLNGRPVEACQVQYLDGDGLLTSTAARRGLRAYLAIRGQWDLPTVLGSREGGLPGATAIQPGWSVDVNWRREAPFSMDLEVDRFYPDPSPALRVVPGPEWSTLDADQQNWLLNTEFDVHPDSNRQGIRLLAPPHPGDPLPNQLSTPVLPGTVQLTPSGPILLGPDAQTIGGYPRVLMVPEPEDLAVAFQVGIGEGLRLRNSCSICKEDS